MIKKMSIKKQMTVLFVTLISLIMIFASIYVPKYFKKSMEKTFFKTIYSKLKANKVTGISDDMYAVQQLYLNSEGELVFGMDESKKSKFLTPDFLEEIKKNALNQVEHSKKYVIETEEVRIYCVIQNYLNKYRVTYMFDVYGDDFRNDIIKQIFILLILLIIFGIVAMYIYSNYLVNRIIKIKSKVEKIADGNWQDSLKVEQEDELGVLSNSIEDMRIKLIEQDKYKNDMFQSISHDLKTPIMIINTYAQSVKDGLYPEGSLENTVDAIIDESEKLDSKVKRILLINKLNYLNQRNEKFSEINMNDVIIGVVNRFRNIREIDFELNIQEAFYEGEFEKWYTALENIIANNIRYAKSIIRIDLKENEITIFNDGPQIEFNNLNDIFLTYKKGDYGENGIGLTITKTIVELFHCKIEVKNVDNGVLFSIKKEKA